MESPYGKKVLTEPHPKKTTWVPCDPPPDLASSFLGPFWASRSGELKMCLLLLLMGLYCTAVYILGYYGFVKHILTVFRHAWDVALLAFIALRFVPRKSRKMARQAALVLTVALAAGRWYEPSLYPKFYPWQPA